MDHLVFAVWRRISTADEACRKDFYDPATFTPHNSLHTNGGQYFFITFASVSLLSPVCVSFCEFCLHYSTCIFFPHCAVELRKFVLLDSKKALRFKVFSCFWFPLAILPSSSWFPASKREEWFIVLTIARCLMGLTNGERQTTTTGGSHRQRTGCDNYGRFANSSLRSFVSKLLDWFLVLV